MSDDYDSCSSDDHSHCDSYDVLDTSPTYVTYSGSRSSRSSYSRRRNSVSADASTGLAIIGVGVLVSLVLWALWAAGAFV
jgi:hypothetical protein